MKRDWHPPLDYKPDKRLTDELRERIQRPDIEAFTVEHDGAMLYRLKFNVGPYRLTGGGVFFERSDERTVIEQENAFNNLAEQVLKAIYSYYNARHNAGEAI